MISRAMCGPFPVCSFVGYTEEMLLPTVQYFHFWRSCLRVRIPNRSEQSYCRNVNKYAPVVLLFEKYEMIA